MIGPGLARVGALGRAADHWLPDRCGGRFLLWCRNGVVEPGQLLDASSAAFHRAATGTAWLPVAFFGFLSKPQCRCLPDRVGDRVFRLP